jgi:hypothetical protein
MHRHQWISKKKLAAVYFGTVIAYSSTFGNWSANSAQAQIHSPGLDNATVLVIRHAEKPPSGDGLTDQGKARADAYAKYFHPFNDGKESFDVDALYATSDTTRSARPKLTLTPLSQALNLPVDTRFGNYDFPGPLIASRTAREARLDCLASRQNCRLDQRPRRRQQHGTAKRQMARQCIRLGDRN